MSAERHFKVVWDFKTVWVQFGYHVNVLLMFTWKTHCGLKFHFGLCTEVSFTPPEDMWTLIIKLPRTEVKFYPEVKSQTCLSYEKVSLGARLTRPKGNSNRFEIPNRFEMTFHLHGNLHGDFTSATFQAIAKLYCTCSNDTF